MKQHNFGPLLGAIKVQAGRSQFYAGLVQTVLVAVAARTQLLDWFPWLPFWVVLSGIAVLWIATGLIDYLFILPAEIEFTNRQSTTHPNPAMDILRRLDHESPEKKD